jgi:hypothetical protein
MGKRSKETPLQKSLKTVVNTLSRAVSKRTKMLGGYLSSTKRTYKKYKGQKPKMRKTQRLFSSLLPSVLNK